MYLLICAALYQRNLLLHSHRMVVVAADIAAVDIQHLNSSINNNSSINRIISSNRVAIRAAMVAVAAVVVVHLAVALLAEMILAVGVVVGVAVTHSSSNKPLNNHLVVGTFLD